MHHVAVLVFSLPVAHQSFQPFEHGIAGGGGHGCGHGLGGKAASRDPNHDGKEQKTTANHESLLKNVAVGTSK
jgi:hypothetical protein